LDAVNSYVAEKGLRQNDLFWAVAQAVLEVLVPWGRGKTLDQISVQERVL